MSFLVKLIGSNIRKIRKQKNFTQEDLAEKSGLQYSYLAGVERGERNITIQTLEKILDGLQVSPKAVFSTEVSIDSDEDFSRNERVKLINGFLEQCDSKELNLFYTLVKGIHDTYKS
jgi:transcriptional regulator with XRE-family HTH domain